MDKDKLNAFADKVFGDRAGAMIAGMGYIGSRPTSRLRSSAAAARRSRNSVPKACSVST